MSIRTPLLTLALISLVGSTGLAENWDEQPREARAYHQDRGPKHGPDIEAFADQLGLDQETKDKLKAIKRQTRHDMMDARFAVKKEKLTLRELLEEEAPNERQIMSQLEEIGRLEVEARKIKVRSLLAARELLTPEQRLAVKELRRAQKDKRRGDRKHRKMKRHY